MASLLGNSSVTARHYFLDQEAAATDLTKKQQEHLDRLQATFPEAELFDLSQHGTYARAIKLSSPMCLDRIQDLIFINIYMYYILYDNKHIYKYIDTI